ncbi:MAG TPA: helix-turn-helix transcriptional regulator [Verrucomicrobiae bacterium]|nr:helix-turn-helix transcriptional regulator [Verrucomicrobiae bacterium]
MPKSTFSREYEVFCGLLSECREKKGLTQTQLCLRLKKPQSYVSKYEMGERRLDMVELLFVCRALGITLTGFANRLEVLIASDKKARARHTGRGPIK